MTSTTHMTFRGFVNPLAFLQVDEPWNRMFGGQPTVEDMLAYTVGTCGQVDLQAMVTRYQEISRESPRVHVAPSHERILSRIVFPLRYAKACYMLGCPLATIALCGLVAEMLAVLLWEAWCPTCTSGVPSGSGNAQKRESDSRFEHVAQKKRIAQLRERGIIDDSQQRSFEQVRILRNTYVHSLGRDDRQIDSDAVQAFCATASLVAQHFARIDEGSVILAPQIIRYLHERGIVAMSAAATTSPGQSEPGVAESGENHGD